MRRLTTEAVLDRLGFKSRETLRQLCKKGKFPRPLRDEGSSLNFWMEQDVDDYLQKFVGQRNKSANSKEPAQMSA